MKSFKKFITEQAPPTIRVTVPLFIRMLEYAKEDAKTDLDLHVATEKAQALHDKGIEILDMENYETITGKS
jgi:hypothetical protein